MSDLRQRYESLLQRPEVRSLLNTIRYAEGTPGDAGYQTMFGGSKFDTSKGWQHPNKAISSGGYTSTAAGAYQFLQPTWQGTAKALGLTQFDPKSQDLAALYLIDKKRGALEPFLKGEKFGTVINKLAPEWAALPTSGGGSYYGQPSKKLGDLYQYYEQQKQKGGTGSIASQQLQQPQQQLQQAGMPNINIIIADGAKTSSTATSDPLSFLLEYQKNRRSSIPSPMEMAKAMTTTEPVNYFG
jgi:muramidase (phage lysozyme)